MPRHSGQTTVAMLEWQKMTLFAETATNENRSRGDILESRLERYHGLDILGPENTRGLLPKSPQSTEAMYRNIHVAIAFGTLVLLVVSLGGAAPSPIC